MENIVLKHLIIQSYCAKPPAECAFSWQQLLKSIHKACYGSVPSSMLSEHLQEGHNGLSAWISGFRRTSQSRLNGGKDGGMEEGRLKKGVDSLALNSNPSSSLSAPFSLWTYTSKIIGTGPRRATVVWKIRGFESFSNLRPPALFPLCVQFWCACSGVGSGGIGLLMEAQITQIIISKLVS